MDVPVYPKADQDLKGDALTAALEKENWDSSVKSLANFPRVLDMMNEKLDWTQKLGDAFLAQQKEVMGTVQKLRAKVEAQGNPKPRRRLVRPHLPFGSNGAPRRPAAGLTPETSIII